jgi:hypothetical protein
VIGLGVLAQDLALVARLLQPLHRRIARAAHRPRVGARGIAGGDQHRRIAAPGGVDGRAVVQRAHVHVRAGGRGLAAHHRRTDRRVQRRRFVDHGDKRRGRPPLHPGLHHRLLVVGQLGARYEEQVVDPAQLHRRDHRISPLVGAVFVPEIARDLKRRVGRLVHALLLSWPSPSQGRAVRKQFPALAGTDASLDSMALAPGTPS